MAAKETIGAAGGSSHQAPFWTTTENPFLNYSTFANDALKEIWGWQVKTGQAFFDHGVKLGHAVTDYAQGQTQEAVRLTHEGWKQSAHLAEEVRKSFTDLTERVKKAN